MQCKHEFPYLYISLIKLPTKGRKLRTEKWSLLRPVHVENFLLYIFHIAAKRDVERIFSDFLRIFTDVLSIHSHILKSSWSPSSLPFLHVKWVECALPVNICNIINRDSHMERRWQQFEGVKPNILWQMQFSTDTRSCRYFT